MPELKKHSEDYIVAVRKATAIQIRAEEFGEEKTQRLLKQVMDDWKIYNKEHGLDDVELNLDKDALKTLTDEFNRADEKDKPGIWGRNWFANIDEFMVFSDNLASKESSVNLAEEDDLILDEEKKAPEAK